jgi:hypothetical protein
MSNLNELESHGDSAMVMNLESFGVDGAGYDETETEPPTLKFDKPAVKPAGSTAGPGP